MISINSGRSETPGEAVLVDTSVWIDFFNAHASAEARLLAAWIADGEPIEIPGIVLCEILAGLRSDAEATRIAGLLEAFDELPQADRDDHLEAARIFRACRSRGRAIRSIVDCLIAQECLRNDLALLTRDRDFHSIAQCTSLRLVEVPG